MQLFLVASLPLFFSLVMLLPWGKRGGVPPSLALVITFLKGVLLFFPGYLVILIVRAVAGFSYDGFLLYLSVFTRDHFAPVVTAVGAFLLIQRTLAFSGTDEGIFLTVFSFLCGFLSMVNLTDLVRGWNVWTSYDLFLLPVLRLAAVLGAALAAPRFFRWEGRDALFYAGAAAALAAVLAVASYLDKHGLPLWSVADALVSVAAGVTVFALKFPRAARG